MAIHKNTPQKQMYGRTIEICKIKQDAQITRLFIYIRWLFSRDNEKTRTGDNENITKSTQDLCSGYMDNYRFCINC